MYHICFILSLFISIITIVSILRLMKSEEKSVFFTPVNVSVVGLFLAIFVGIIPYFSLEENIHSGFLLAFVDLLQTFAIFVVDDSAGFLQTVTSNGLYVSGIYRFYMGILFALAPFVTMSVLISFFKDRFSYILFHFKRHKDIYAFSSINEKSIILAFDLRKEYPKALIVFSKENSDEPSPFDLQLQQLKAYVFTSDLNSIDFSHHDLKLTFIICGQDQRENVISSLKLIGQYQNREDTHVFVCASNLESELLLSNVDKGKVKVRRVNEVRSLVYHYFYEHGHQLFRNAIQKENHKDIQVVLLGLGQYGSEILKTLAWYCQMDDYKLKVDVFEQDPLAFQKFSATCPELMSDQLNGKEVEGESIYDIQIHSGIDVDTLDFMHEFEKLENPTSIFVCLGSDQTNIDVSVKMRMLSSRRHLNPTISTIIYNPEEKKAIANIHNFKNQDYEIQTIGDIHEMYSKDVLLASNLEKLALDRHLKWGKEEDFWLYEYNYCSSMALAIAHKARIECQIQGTSKKEEELTASEALALEQLEHRRWNTYMRSQGYVYSGSTNKQTRNDLAKMHHDLVPFDKLSKEEKEKDMKAGTK